MMDRQCLGQQIIQKLPSTTVGKYDLSPVFADKLLFSNIIQNLSAPYAGIIDLVVSPEALGWIVGSAIANELGVGLTILRKGGHFPYPSEQYLYSESFIDYDKKRKSLQIPVASDLEHKRLLIADEWIATGAQVNAIRSLLTHFSCTVVGLATIGVERNPATQAWMDSGLLQYIFVDEPR